MARFRGTVQGGRGMASRLGHQSLIAMAQSFSGDIAVHLYRGGNDEDMVKMYVCTHWGNTVYNQVQLYDGPVAALLNNRHAIVEEFARQQLKEQFDGKA